MGTSSIKYEPLVREHTNEVLALCESWWYEANWFKNTKMLFRSEPAWWDAMFDSGMMMGCVGRDAEDKLVGCWVAMKMPYQFNHSYLVASEIVWCLDKDYRNGKNLLQLLKEIESTARDNQVHYYNLNLPVEESSERLANKLVTRGFFKQDLSLFKETFNG